MVTAFDTIGVLRLCHPHHSSKGAMHLRLATAASPFLLTVTLVVIWIADDRSGWPRPLLPDSKDQGYCRQEFGEALLCLPQKLSFADRLHPDHCSEPCCAKGSWKMIEALVKWQVWLQTHRGQAIRVFVTFVLVPGWGPRWF